MSEPWTSSDTFVYRSRDYSRASALAEGDRAAEGWFGVPVAELVRDVSAYRDDDSRGMFEVSVTYRPLKPSDPQSIGGAEQ
jgi:hypothetical protein